MKSIHLSNSIAKIEIAPSLGGAILAYEAKIKGCRRDTPSKN